MNYLRTAVAAATLALGMSSAFADPATLRLLSQNPSNDKAYPSEVATIAWIERCSQTYPNCGKVWEDTIGKALGIKIQ